MNSSLFFLLWPNTDTKQLPEIWQLLICNSKRCSSSRRGRGVVTGPLCLMSRSRKQGKRRAMLSNPRTLSQWLTCSSDLLKVQQPSKVVPLAGDEVPNTIVYGGHFTFKLPEQAWSDRRMLRDAELLDHFHVLKTREAGKTIAKNWSHAHS